MALTIPALATSDAWTGGGADFNWATNANWATAPAVVPGTGDTATFNNSTAGVAQTIITGNIQIGTLLFDTAGAAAYTLGGATAGTGQITLDNSGAVTMSSTVTANELINANLLLGTATTGAYTITNASTTNSLTLAGSIQGGTGGTAAAKTLNVTGAGSTTLGGTLAKGGGSSLSLTVTSTGTTTLSGTGNSIATLGISTGAGNLTLASDLTLSGSTLLNGSGGTINSTGGNILLGVAAGDIGVSNGGTLTINAVIANGTQSSVDFFNTTSGTGIVVLKADNTFTGAARIQSGVVSVSKIGDAGVAGNLGTTGTINLGSTTGTATLKYTGGGEANNRVLDLSGTTGTVTLDSSGTGLLKLTSDLTATGGGAKTLTLGGTGTGEIAGRIVDNTATFKTAVTKSGAGTWTLSGANHYTGNTTLTLGTLQVANSAAFGSGTFVFNGGTLNNTSGAALTLANPVSITASSAFGTSTSTSASNVTFSDTTAFSADLTRTLTLAGTGVTLTVAATWNNTVDTSGRVLTVNGAGNTFVLGGIALDNVAAGVTHTHSINGTGNVTISGPVTNGAAATVQALTYSGSGTLTLNGNNTYLGTTTMNNAAGTLTLAGDNSAMTSGVTLTTGRLNINNANALAKGTFTLTAGTIDNTSGAAVTNAGNNALSLGNFTFGGTNDLNLGTGTLSNSFARTVTLNGTATLTLPVWTNTSDADQSFTVNGPGRTLVIGGLALDSTGTTSKTQTIAGTGNLTIAGAIVNGAGTSGQKFAVTNSGIVTLQGANLYTGATSVTSGTLVLGSGGTLAATPVSVAAGATFGARPGVNGATNSMGGSLTLISGSNFSMQDGATSTLTAATTTAFTGGVGSAIGFDLGGTTTAADRLTITGAASGTGGTVIDIKGIGSTAPATGAYTIISAASGLNNTNFSLSQNKVTIGGTPYEITLTRNAATTVLNVTGNTGLDQAWWTGDQDAVWNTNGGNTNWATNSTGAIEAGAVPNSVTDVFFSAPAATHLATSLGANTVINSLTFAGGSGAVTVATGNTLTIGSIAGITVQSGAAAPTIDSAVALTTTQAWTNDSSNPLTVNGIVSGAGMGITKQGTGTLILGASNTYTGPTTIGNGTLRIDASQTLTGPLNFASSNGATTLGNLDLSNASATFGAGSVRTNSLTANTVTIGSGKTLTLTGGLSMGYDTPSGTGAVTSNLTIAGAGAFSITGTTVNISLDQSATNAAFFSAATLDLTGLGSGTSGFSANVTNFNVGVGSHTTGVGTLLLSNVANSITATTLQIGNSGGSNGGGATNSIITLGTGTNVIKADTINIGFSKVGGTLTFASQTSGSPGSVTIGNKAGSGAANIVIGTHNGTGTAAVITSLLDLRGHNATVAAGTLSLGLSNNTNTGSATGTLFFDSGTFTATTVTLGSKAGTAGSGTGTGNLNIGGGTFTVNSGGIFTMATNTAATGAAVGNLNVTGGVFTSNVDLLKGGGANTTANVTLNGTNAVIDLAGHNLGSAAQVINFLTQLGTLKNVGEIDGGTTGLAKNTSGLLLVTGSNTYTGPTVVGAGTLQVGSGNTGSTGAGSAVTVNGATSVLSGTGTINGASTIISGQISAGDNGGSGIGTLNFLNDLTFNPASPSTVGTFDFSAPSTNDRLHIAGALTLNSNSNFVLQLTSYAPGLGDTFTLLDWTGLLTLNGWSAGANFRDGSGDGGSNLDLPDISASSLFWEISSMNSGATSGALTLTVVPEPGPSLLIVMGIAGLLGRRRRR